MSDHPVPATLSPAEWKLIQELRTLPDSPLKDRVHAVLSELLFFIRHPQCQGMGIEGFPCGTPQSSCEDCHRIWSTLDLISERARQRPDDPAHC